VRVLGRLFPGRIAESGQKASFDELIAQLFAKEWIVYSKPLFGGPEQVLRYLARYTYRWRCQTTSRCGSATSR
jgi:hypothetical protein